MRKRSKYYYAVTLQQDGQYAKYQEVYQQSFVGELDIAGIKQECSGEGVAVVYSQEISKKQFNILSAMAFDNVPQTS